MTNPLPLRIFIALFYLALSVPAAAEDTPLLSMPLACTVGETCFIQTYTPNGQLFGFPFCKNIVKRPETTALDAHDHPRIDRTTTGQTI
jgi:hypothetical protein